MVYGLHIVQLMLLISILKPLDGYYFKVSKTTQRLVTLTLLPGSQSLVFFLVGNIAIDVFRWFSRTQGLDFSTNNLIFGMLLPAYIASYLHYRHRYQSSLKSR